MSDARLTALEAEIHSVVRRHEAQADRDRQGVLQLRNDLLAIQTGPAPDFIDITERVEDLLRRTGIVDGQALVFSRHTTAAVRVQEAEPLLLQDMTACLERLAPRELDYQHNDFRGRTRNMTENE